MRKGNTWTTTACWTTCEAVRRFPTKDGSLDAASSSVPLILPNVFAGTPIIREPNINRADELFIWWSEEERSGSLTATLAPVFKKLQQNIQRLPASFLTTAGHRWVHWLGRGSSHWGRPLGWGQPADLQVSTLQAAQLTRKCFHFPAQREWPSQCHRQSCRPKPQRPARRRGKRFAVGFLLTTVEVVLFVDTCGSRSKHRVVKLARTAILCSGVSCAKAGPGARHRHRSGSLEEQHLFMHTVTNFSL